MDRLDRDPDGVADREASPAPLPASALPGLVWGAFNRELIGRVELARDYRLVTLRVGDRFWSLHVRRDVDPPR